MLALKYSILFHLNTDHILTLNIQCSFQNPKLTEDYLNDVFIPAQLCCPRVHIQGVMKGHTAMVLETERVQQYKSISEYNLKKKRNPELLETEHNSPRPLF